MTTDPEEETVENYLAYNPATGENDIPATSHEDGSTTYHFGMGGGDVTYDQFGNEC